MKTDIVMILDRSGSMEAIAQDTIGGVNTFLVDQKTAPGEATFTLVQFDNQYELVHDAVPIARAEPLTAKTFIPRASTALLDAIGRTIDATGQRLSALSADKRPDKVVCVIVSDGQENASRTFTRAQVFDKITHQRDVYKWEFVFLGANQDAITEAGEIGIPAAAAMNYAPTAGGVKASYGAMSAGLRAMRAGSRRCMAFSDDDRKKAMSSK